MGIYTPIHQEKEDEDPLELELGGQASGAQVFEALNYNSKSMKYSMKDMATRSKHFIYLLARSKRFVLLFSIVFLFLFTTLGGLVLVQNHEGSKKAVYSVLGVQDDKPDPKALANEEFIRMASTTEIDGPFNPVPMQQLCSRMKWNPKVIIHCGDASGGIGNVRNIMLNCIRYAMEAGGALIIPKQIARDTADLGAVYGDTIMPFSHFFDVDHFKESMTLGCPQMALYDSIEKVPGFPDAKVPDAINPVDFDDLHDYDRINHNPKEWRPRFDAWLDKQRNGDRINIVRLERSYFQVNVYTDGFLFANNFGKVLRFRSDVRTLAAKVLLALSEKYNIEFNNSIQIRPDKFYGAHLRTDQDVAEIGWINYDDQVTTYMNHAKSADLKIMYVASGNTEDVAKFAVTAWEKEGINVTQKHLLLTGNDLQQLKNMTWDQQGLVDYSVMLSASKFGGLEQSSFSWNIAMRRHMTLVNWNGANREKDIETALVGPYDVFHDDLTVLVGSVGNYPFFPHGIWI